jgi:hypothetical protein
MFARVRRKSWSCTCQPAASHKTSSTGSRSDVDPDLSAERYAIALLDGFHLKVPRARRVVSVPVLAALGMTEAGQQCLLTLRLAALEPPSPGAPWS